MRFPVIRSVRKQLHEDMCSIIPAKRPPLVRGEHWYETRFGMVWASLHFDRKDNDCYCYRME